jgi:hypothetical protein
MFCSKMKYFCKFKQKLSTVHARIYQMYRNNCTLYTANVRHNTVLLSLIRKFRYSTINFKA